MSQTQPVVCPASQPLYTSLLPVDAYCRYRWSMVSQVPCPLQLLQVAVQHTEWEEGRKEGRSHLSIFGMVSNSPSYEPRSQANPSKPSKHLQTP